MKVHAAIAQTLADQGVDTMFGVIGDGNMFYAADFDTIAGCRYAGAVTESGAVAMADGYARASGRPGVVTATSGPGATNTITALTEATRARTPLVLLTGEAPAKRGWSQRIELSQVFAATGADFHRVLSPDQLVDDLAGVLSRAAMSRRPAVVDIAHALMHSDIDYRRSRHSPHLVSGSAPDADSMENALGRIALAQRPLVVAGLGAVRSGAKKVLLELAERLGAPLATTANAKDYFRGHPYDLGIMGSVSAPYTSGILAAADCFIFFGASMARHTLMDGDLTRDRTVIQVTIDREDIDRTQHADVALLGDASSTAQRMLAMLAEADLPISRFRVNAMGDGSLRRSPLDDFRDCSGPDGADPRAAMIALDELLPENRAVVTDVGRFVPAPWRYLGVRDSRDFFHTGAFGSIGLGLPAAIGAAMARPDRLTVCVTGDGGLMMSLIELHSAVKNALPLLIVVLNDRAYGSEYSKFEAFGYSPATCYQDWPDLVGVARSLGCTGRTVASAEELRTAMAAHPDLARPFLLDVRVEPTIDPSAA